MKLLVGLGNIGKKYEQTRHNVGFLALDFLAEKFHASEWKESSRFFGTVATGMYHGKKILLLKPSTFMNLSGKSVAAVANFYKINRSDITVIFDDVDLPFAKIRLRHQGGSGGHNGIKSLIACLGGEDFTRIKIGISNEFRASKETADFVLAKFLPAERTKLSAVFHEIYTNFLSEIG
ncbi:aminoacyl-tRNA hydrolase [bacterium DOLZORAL124_38_8]|nr:MAG: aminoacyl-tRNA hydrolase [bacterium DOLZORAL124_38_8]